MTDEDNDFEIFQIDETVFIGADHMRKSYSNSNSNIILSLTHQQEKQSSKVMGAISSKGSYFYYDRSHYFTAEDVLKFVKLIKQKMRGKQWQYSGTMPRSIEPKSLMNTWSQREFQSLRTSHTDRNSTALRAYGHPKSRNSER